MGRIEPETLITCFNRYMAEAGLNITRAQFEKNLEEKRKRPDFRDDVGPLIRHDLSWECDESLYVVLEKLVSRLPGDPWRG